MKIMTINTLSRSMEFTLFEMDDNTVIAKGIIERIGLEDSSCEIKYNDDVEEKLRAYSKEMYAKAEKIKFPSKHKYAFVLGRDKRETKRLRAEFKRRNKIYPYPKKRGE